MLAAWTVHSDLLCNVRTQYLVPEIYITTMDGRVKLLNIPGSEVKKRLDEWRVMWKTLLIHSTPMLHIPYPSLSECLFEFPANKSRNFEFILDLIILGWRCGLSMLDERFAVLEGARAWLKVR